MLASSAEREMVVSVSISGVIVAIFLEGPSREGIETLNDSNPVDALSLPLIRVV